MLKKNFRKILIFSLLFIVVFSGFPAYVITDYLSERNIVDNVYWASKMSNVVDNFGVKNAYAADGSGTNIVSPNSTVSNTAGNTFNFTFTAAETMDSGVFRIAVPASWSAPQLSPGTAGYTTATSPSGMVADVLTTADTIAGTGGSWLEDDTDACNTANIRINATTKKEGAASIECNNSASAAADDTDSFAFRYTATSNWSSYTKMAAWIYVTKAMTATNYVQLAYDDTSGMTTPLQTLNLTTIPASTWTYVTMNLTAARTAVKEFGIICKGAGCDSDIIYVDYFLIGPGKPIITGTGPWGINVALMNLSAGQTVSVSYGAGGGASGVLTPTVAIDTPYTFTTASRIGTGGTFVDIATSPVITVTKPANSPPALTVTQPDGTGDTVNVGDPYNITYDLSDAEDAATVDFYYDTDTNSVNGYTAIATCQNQIEGVGATCPWDTTGMTPGSYYVYGIATDLVNPDVSDYSPGMITINAAAATLTIGTTAGPQAVNLDSGAVSQYANSAACNGPASCAAFSLSISSGSETITSIKITETGTANAAGTLGNLALFYDTDGNYSNGVTGQYGSTAASFPFETAPVTGSLTINSGTTYYFYARFDLAKSGVYPKGGETIGFQIAANADIGTSGSPTKTGAPATLAGTTTVRPNATSITYGSGLSDGGRSGESITISGYGFGAPAVGVNREDCTTATVDRGCVKFIAGGTTNVANANITAWSNTSITFTTASALATYGGVSAVEVRAANQADSTPLTFYIYPNITSAPVNGQIGNLITISGDHFGVAAGNIIINTKSAAAGTWTETSLTNVRIPGQEGAANIGGKIQITRSDGKTSNQYPSAGNFTILAPLVSSSNPSSAATGQTLTIEFSGPGGIDTDAGTAPTLKLTKGGQLPNCTPSANCIVGVSYAKVTDYQTVSASFDLSGAATGYWKIVVVNMDTQSGAYGNETTSGFNVTPLAPTVTGINPGFGQDSGTVIITSVSGTNFQNGAAVKLAKTAQTDIASSPAFTFTDSNTLSNGTFDLNLKTNGWWNVVVTNPDLQTASYGNETTSGFEIRSAKPLTPANIYQFQTNTDTAQPPTANIAVGGGIGGQTTIWFRMDMEGGLTGESYFPQVEVQPVGAAFECLNNSPTPCTILNLDGFFAQGSGVTYNGSAAQGWVNINGIDGTSYHWQVRVRNSAGTSNWVSFGGNNDPNDSDITIDATAPIICQTECVTGTDACNNAAINITDLETTIKWNTSDSASGAQIPPGPGAYATAQVQYIKTSQFSDWISTPGNLSPTVPSPRENSPHQIAISGLSPSTSYTYRMRSKDAVGNEKLSSDCIFSTTSSRPIKTVEIFIGQETNQNTGGLVEFPFTITLPESPTPNIISVKSAFIEITGISSASASKDINIELRRDPPAIYANPGTNFTIDSSGTTTPFTILFDALNPPGGAGNGQEDMTDIITGATPYNYKLFLSGGTVAEPISVFSAKLIITYSYVI